MHPGVRSSLVVRRSKARRSLFVAQSLSLVVRSSELVARRS
jgi:hypothetical protein